MKFGWVRVGVVQGENASPTTLDPVIPYTRWRPEYDELNDGDPPHVMNLELQHACIIFENRLKVGSPMLTYLTNPVGYAKYKMSIPIEQAWESTKEQFVLGLHRELTNRLGPYKYGSQQAKARYSKDVPIEEKDFLTKRLVRVREALGKFLEMDLSSLPLDQVPRIGIASSGGGYRAMLASLGVLVELESQGVLDCVTYHAGLSGGSWLLANIYGSTSKTLPDLRDVLKSKLEQPFYSTNMFPSTILSQLRERLAQNDDLSLIDSYSWHLQHHLFRDFPTKPELWNQARISEQSEKCADGGMPLPIYTAVTALDAGRCRWVEVTPYEFGLRDDVNAFIPTWSIGRKFKDGISQDSHVEPTLAFMAGVFGSAFCATVDQIFSNVIENATVQRILHQLLYKQLPTLGDERLVSSAEFVNPFEKGALSQQVNLNLFDAGCDANIPFHPLIRPERKCDVIIALDQSAGVDQYLSTNLSLAAEYAAKFHWPFPDCSAALKIEKNSNSKKVGKKMSAASMKALTICDGSVEKGIPTVMYMSLLRNEKFDPHFDPRRAKFCATSNWVYKKEQVDLLTGLTAFNTRQSVDQIKKTLRNIVEQKMAIATKRPSPPSGQVAAAPE